MLYLLSDILILSDILHLTYYFRHTTTVEAFRHATTMYVRGLHTYYYYYYQAYNIGLMTYYLRCANGQRAANAC